VLGEDFTVTGDGRVKLSDSAEGVSDDCSTSDVM
jgi:hypothetical protein